MNITLFKGNRKEFRVTLTIILNNGKCCSKAFYNAHRADKKGELKMKYNGQEIITSTQLKRAMNKLGTYEYKLSNININGSIRGCSGFISNGNRVAYINTERVCYNPLNDKILYRLAESMSDYGGGRNRWTNHYNVGELAECVKELLEKGN